LIRKFLFYVVLLVMLLFVGYLINLQILTVVEPNTIGYRDLLGFLNS
jgi:hypothetical protein